MWLLRWGCVYSAWPGMQLKLISCSGSEAMEGALKLARQVSIKFRIVGCLNKSNILFSTGMNRSSLNAKISFLETFPTTVTQLLHFLCQGTPHAADHMQKFSIIRTSTRCRQPTRSASATRKNPRSSTWKGSARSSRTSFSSLDQIPS